MAHTLISDWYFVPLYGTCRYVALNEELVANATTQSYSSEADVLPDMDVASDGFIYGRVLSYLREQRAWHRREGRDHIFLFADGQGPRIWDAHELLRESVLLSPESKCPTWGEPSRRYVDVRPCLSTTWKDVVIPGHTDYARIRYMR